MRTSHDTIVIGAGAAGLACAEVLRRAGLDVIILEARDRIGGRILTASDSSGLKVELGAEFMHGAESVLLKRLADGPFYGVADEHLFFDGRRLLRKDDFWESIHGINRRLNGKLKNDRSVADFLLSHRFADEKSAPLFVSYIEGFQAADTHFISEVDLARGEKDETPELNGESQFRIVHGYNSLFEETARELKAVLRLRHPVERVQWSKGQASAFSKGRPFTAKTVVITIPLGVLKSHHSSTWIDPLPRPVRDALDGLQMGHAQRITFRFKTRFWEKLDRRPVSFLHAGPEFHFPTWWTPAPIRAPLIVAWQGGPKALEMAEWEEEKRAFKALETLSAVCGLSPRRLRSELVDWKTHNWSADPWSQGAYSYVGVGGFETAKALSRGYQETLFFAGEATSHGAARGTVHGALQSGLRAARQVLKNFK